MPVLSHHSQEAAEREEKQKEVVKEKMQELQVRRPTKKKKTYRFKDHPEPDVMFQSCVCQEMDGTIAELSHQLVKLSLSISDKKKHLALMRKDRREKKEVQRDEMEVRPLTVCVPSVPTIESI